MKKIKFSLFAVALLFVFSNVNAQKLKGFDSSIDEGVEAVDKKVPYAQVISYLGHASPENEDEIKEDKKIHYIYVWIPAVTPELGVRMASPAGKVKMKKSIVDQSYEENKNSKDYFDTYITLERSNIISKDDLDNASSANWIFLAQNDDSVEMPNQPNGESNNSLLRYKSKTGDALGALTVGLYRIGFTTYKEGEVKGTFIAQIGSPITLLGLEMAKTVEELKTQL